MRIFLGRVPAFLATQIKSLIQHMILDVLLSINKREINSINIL